MSDLRHLTFSERQPAQTARSRVVAWTAGIGFALIALLAALDGQPRYLAIVAGVAVVLAFDRLSAGLGFRRIDRATPQGLLVLVLLVAILFATGAVHAFVTSTPPG